ncbi:putative beige beach domain-containing protein [Phaeoacremonium minimum UCRPA7]|uniref:Beige protein homolog 1 n=1 Tax=Phaeoacremonium minimum (strain UCR-PA7) TaxID=1286976 RepID=R8BJS2_PHAM7|nr:putative beige beach domain-containing protein [Phaeoacremonium minimum UCRPA7]EON99561.1 putative beige beach domain-containing protein [Phaeoacremonium minimum UCRPA7]
MRIVKRLLDALKAETISEDILPHFIASFKSLVKCNFNAEVHRALALFITYALHTVPHSLPRTPKPLSAISRGASTPNLLRRTTVPTDNSSAPVGSKALTKKQVGTRMLDLYTSLLCEKGSLVDIRKFARTVTNKVTYKEPPSEVFALTSGQWLLYLLADDDPEIVVYGTKILARLLVTHGSSYTSKFASKTGGFWIMAHRLKHWWDISTLWPICFSILFGYDVAEINFDRPFDFFNLIEVFGKCRVVYPDVLPVITSMLQHGLRDILKYQDDPDSPVGGETSPTKGSPNTSEPVNRPRGRSMALSEALESRQTRQRDRESITNHAVVLQTVVRFLADFYSRSVGFQDFALSSEYVRLLLSALYPVIVSTDPVNPETELNSKDSALTFEGGDVIIRPVTGSAGPAPIVRTSTVASTEATATQPQSARGTQLRRASSFILLTAQQHIASTARLAHVMSPKKKVAAQKISNVVLDGLMELVVSVFTDQVLVRKEFPGFSLFLKVPPGFQEHQAYFESYVLRNTISHLSSAVQLNQKVLCEPKILTNMARFNVHIVEAIFEGWFMNGAESMLDFTGMVLEYLQRPEISSLKSVRLCSQAVATIRVSFLKLVLLRLSDMDDSQVSDQEALSVLERLFYWQTVLLDCLTTDDDYMKLLWYQLYAKLIDSRESIRLAAASIWRIMLVQKPQETSTLLRQFVTPDQLQLMKGFRKLTEVDDDTFIEWVDQHRPSLDVLFLGGISRTWEDFVSVENQRTMDTARSRLTKRKEKLKVWHTEGLERENVLLRHEMANGAWMKSIYITEHFKHQRLAQDQQDDLAFLLSSFGKMDRELKRPGAIFASPSTSIKWKLDRTEGRNRMRLRLLPDYSKSSDEYQPKEAKKKGPEAIPSVASLRLDTKVNSSSSGISATPISTTTPFQLEGDSRKGLVDLSAEPGAVPSSADQAVSPEDDFELVDDPNDPDGDDAFEDKNRKVMRRLEHGDTVQSVYNVSRIIGLEACEGILIIGKEALYLMDNVFRSADGEIINVWQAPPEERDPYSQIITGTSKSVDKRPSQNRSEQESRSWRWHDVISISKRRFLFRDVAIEIFFTDGRSYLLTALNVATRDEVYNKLRTKTPHTDDPKSLPNPEDAWRLEALRVFDEAPQTFGSKFGSIFNSSPWNPTMRRWQKGELSNFHYLMLVNTMAGRTFNDLTQYPVFPWILADYTSEELDLNDPKTFRDLSKPMGAQTVARQTDYMLRYSSLAEIEQVPFHYGTHYSSAMVVCSYLIRLPPFVQSYILLQGGTFDHPDRMFYSIEGAWNSASRDNGTDVRELIPEFYYLPDFLTNINGYNFGVRQGKGGKIDNVALPPWAKGDPKIFIAKHREALESPYVTQNLQHWIDLVFGYKQRGEAAVDNLNVFHNLSYHGAIDLDNITDPQERAITTGIIHNFGQTPHQVFSKPHPPREHAHNPIKRLDTSVNALTRIPYPLLGKQFLGKVLSDRANEDTESHERVASLIYAPKLDRLLCASPFRINIPPIYDKFLEWGYADNSVRFFHSDNRKPAGLFENLHQGQISCAIFADSKTLITAGEDCVVSVYAVQNPSGKNVELLPRLSLFGHKTPVNTIAVSKAFSTFVTVSQDGTTFLWDLNRLEFIRKLPLNRAVECARINDVSGEIMLCSGPSVLIYSLNGDLILEQNVCGAEGQDDFVQSCAFYEGSANEWLENFLVFTGHRRGRVNVWRKTVGKNGRWILEFLRRLDHVDPKSETGANVEAPITCITTMPQLLYTGDDDGRVYEWNLIQRER